MGVGGGISFRDEIRHLEATGEIALPWRWNLGGQWSVSTVWRAGLGWIGDERHGTVIGSTGPAVRLSLGRMPLSLIGGMSPTLVGENHIGGTDMGSAFHFTSHIGLVWQITSELELGYRIQHMSNGGLRGVNPGLNEHMVGVSWRF